MDLFSEGCPMDFHIEDCPMSFQKQKSFVLKTVSHTWKMHVRGSRRGLETWGMACKHSGRNVHIFT